MEVKTATLTDRKVAGLNRSKSSRRKVEVKIATSTGQLKIINENHKAQCRIYQYLLGLRFA